MIRRLSAALSSCDLSFDLEDFVTIHLIKQIVLLYLHRCRGPSLQSNCCGEEDLLRPRLGEQQQTQQMSQTAAAVAAGTHPGPPSVMQLGGDSRNVPVYVLFLIMLSSGIVTLLILWGCVQYINHKRRFNNTAANGDIERNGMARGSLAEGHVASRNEHPQQPLTASSSAKHQETGAQLTYVVMAGEDKPTFLALPSTKTFRADPSPQPTEMATMKIEK